MTNEHKLLHKSTHTHSTQNQYKKPQNIWAVGRNYLAHAQEMNSPVPSSPLIFLKSGGCLDTSTKITIPTWSTEVHYELELGFYIDENLKFSGLTLALDLTARDHQENAKKKGHPWTLAKSFSGSCPIAPWLPISSVENLNQLSFELKKNDTCVQVGIAQDMIFHPATLLEHIQKYFPVQPGDILLTGTPEGVGPLRSGDHLQANLYHSLTEKHTLLTCHWDVV